MERYVKVYVKPRYDNGETLTFNLDLEDINDKYLYKMFKEQDRLDKVEDRKKRNNDII